MALIDLSKARDEDTCSPCVEPYVYGVCISLDDAQCKALGLTKPPRAGAITGLKAVAVFRRSTEEIDQAGDSEKEVYVQLQITHMELVDPPKGYDTAKRLYGDD